MVGTGANWQAFKTKGQKDYLHKDLNPYGTEKPDPQHRID